MSADMSLFCFCVPTDNRPPFERLEPYWSMFVRALYVQKRQQLAGVSMLPPIKGHAWAAAYTVGRGGMGLDQRCPLSYKYQMYGTSSQKAPDQQMFVSLDHTTCKGTCLTLPSVVFSVVMLIPYRKGFSRAPAKLGQFFM